MRRDAAPLLCLFALLSSPAWLEAQAETDTAMDGSWHFRLLPYFWATGLDGTASVTGVTEVPIKASFSDIIEDFDIGFATHFEARKDRLGFAADVMYTNLGADVPTTRLILGRLDLNADVRQLITEGFVFYRPVSRASRLPGPPRRTALQRHPHAAQGDRGRRQLSRGHEAHLRLGRRAGRRPLPRAPGTAGGPYRPRRPRHFRLRPDVERPGRPRSTPWRALGLGGRVPVDGRRLRQGRRPRPPDLQHAVLRAVALGQLLVVTPPRRR